MLARKLLAATPVSGSGGGLSYVARAWGDTSGATAGAFTINKPVGTATGDLMIAAIAGTTASFSADAGWKSLGSASRSPFGLNLFSKEVTSSEPSSYTFTSSGPLQKLGGEIQTWRATATDRIGTFYQGTGTADIVAPSIRPGDNGVVLAFVTTSASGGTYSTPSGMTSRAVTNTNQPSMASFYQTVVNGVDTGTRTSTPATSGNQRGVLLTLKGA